MMFVEINRSGKYSKFIMIPKSYVKELGWSWSDKLLFEQHGNVITISRTDQASENVRRLRLNGYSYIVTIPKKIAKELNLDWVEVEIVEDKIMIEY